MSPRKHESYHYVRVMAVAMRWLRIQPLLACLRCIRRVVLLCLSSGVKGWPRAHASTCEILATLAACLGAHVLWSETGNVLPNLGKQLAHHLVLEAVHTVGGRGMLKANNRLVLAHWRLRVLRAGRWVGLGRRRVLAEEVVRVHAVVSWWPRLVVP